MLHVRFEPKHLFRQTLSSGKNGENMWKPSLKDWTWRVSIAILQTSHGPQIHRRCGRISLQSAIGQWSGPRKGMAQWKSVCTLAPHCLDIIGLTFSCSLQKSQLCNLSEQQECRSQRWETRATCQKNGSGMFWSIWFSAPSGSFAPLGSF